MIDDLNGEGVDDNVEKKIIATLITTSIKVLFRKANSTRLDASGFTSKLITLCFCGLGNKETRTTPTTEMTIFASMITQPP